LIKRPDKDKNPINSEFLRALVHFSHIGVTIAASVFIGVLLGKFLDGFFGTSPWLLLVFSLLGVGAALRVLFSLAKG
jgi:ATP synthase protein I